MFDEELALAKSLQVYVQVRRTKTGCPYLRVFGTGARVDFVLAKGGRSFHTYYADRSSNWEAKLLGRSRRRDIVQLIERHSRGRPRDLWRALGNETVLGITEGLESDLRDWEAAGAGQSAEMTD